MRPRLALNRLFCLALGVCVVLSASLVRAQLPDNTEERLKMLADPEGVKKKLEKEKARPPLEFFRSQVAPFDVLPFVKPNHWFTLRLDMRANHEDYNGWLQSAPVDLLGMPQQIIHRRDARLVKEQQSRISMQLLLPTIPRELTFELRRPDAIREDDVWPASLKKLEPHQMLILVLTKDSNDVYSQWRKLHAVNPSGVDRGDLMALERHRYYQLVLPTEPDKLFLSPHPLTWTSISHVVWDTMPPDRLNVGQQQAMLDWLYWGGQLIIVGGSAASYEVLRDGFLAPYLPAEPTGENALLKEADLAPLSASYPPPVPWADPNDPQPVANSQDEALSQARRYRAKESIIPASNRPLFVAGLRPLHPDAVTIPLGDGSKHTLGIEERLGRGRILMLAINPTDPSLAAWPGIDTLIRRVILRRPEETKTAEPYLDAMGSYHAAALGILGGPDLTWFRYLSRDLGSGAPRPLPYGQKLENPEGTAAGDQPVTKSDEENALLRGRPNLPVAEWIDSSTLPQESQTLLKDASGITVPSSTFVLKVILAYLFALVPLNWVICRYLIGRREWAWVVVPALALGFAVGVERAAAYDIGYDLACDEIDLIESFANYRRAHVSRFTSLYSTGRVRFTISYPNDNTALALPMISGSYLRGSESTTAIFRSSPVPALEGFQVQPRTLGMFRAEQLTNFPGSITLNSPEAGPRQIVNDTDMELRDAVVVDINGPKDRRETYLGTIAPRRTVDLKASGDKLPVLALPDGPKPATVLKALREYYEAGPENSGEIRLVAWTPKPFEGQAIEPAPDRHRGFTALVVHLRYGPPPSPDGAVYNALALAIERPPALEQRADSPLSSQGIRRGRGMRRTDGSGIGGPMNPPTITPPKPR